MKSRPIIFVILTLLVLLSSGSVFASGYWDVDASYTKRHLLNCTNMDDEVPLYFNITIDGKDQVIHTYCFGTGTALYKKNSTDFTEYVMANDTGLLPFIVEFGNGSSHNPTNVWNSSFKQVLLLTDGDNTSYINDSTSNHYDGVKQAANEPNEIDGKIGKAQDFDGIDDIIWINDTTVGTTQTVSFWTKMDVNKINTHHFDFETGRILFQWNHSSNNIAWYDGGAAWIEFGTTPLAGTWYYVVLTLNGGTSESKLYVDMVQSGSTESYTPRSIAGTSCLGASKAPDGWLDGKIDHWTVADVILSDSFNNQTFQNHIGTSGYGDIGAEESQGGGGSGSAPTVTTHVTSPAIVYTNTDFKFNMTATDPENATFTGYVQFYVDGSASGAEQSQAMNNDTNTLIGTLSHSSFGVGASLIAEYWASDGENSSAKANQSTVTVQSGAPNAPVLVNPANNSVNNTNAVNLSVTVTDNQSSVMNVSFYSGTYGRCYQETTNESHANDGSCGLSYTGTYNCEGTWSESYLCSNTYDGDWATWGDVKDLSGDYPNIAYLYSNYTKPSNASSSYSSWQIKITTLPTENITIPSNCWQQSPLQFRIISYFDNSGGTGISHVEAQCYNGSGWEQLKYSQGGLHEHTYKRIYEEAMWWSIAIGNATNIANNSIATYEWTGLADGVYEWYAVVTDGYESTTSDIWTFTLDSTNPLLSITTSNNTYWNTLPTINGTASDANTDTIYSNNTDWDWNSDYSNWGFLNNTNIAQGTYHILITANDTFGNTNSSLFVFTYDSINPSLTITTGNNTINNTMVTIEGTASDTNTDTIYCNDTDWTWNTTYTSWAFTNNTVIADGLYHILITANDSAGNTNSSLFVFTYDTTAPTIVDNFINNSFYLNDNLTGQFNFTDDVILHSLNISIDGESIYINESINDTFLQYNLSIDPTNLSTGEHELFIRIADGHTALELKNPDAYNPSNGIFNNYAKYSIRKPYPRLDITMYLKDQSVLDSWDITRKNNRYSETVRPSNPLTTQIFIVESDKYIHIVIDPKGNYKGQWLIIGNHWKDFVLKDEPDSKVNIKRINDKKVEVTISEIKNTKELVFDSTGDLNIATRTYNFYTSNISINNPDYSFETDIQTITFFLNKTSNITTNAELYWNGSFKASTKTSYTDYDKYTAVFRTPFIANKEENITAYWNYNLTNGDTESGNTTFNQTIYRMSIDTCSEYTTKAINFTLMDEVLNEPLNITGEIHAAMQLYRSNISDYRTTNLDYTGSNNYSLCIYPSWANYTIDFTNFEYMASGYANREYSTSAFEISNSTQEIKLYLISLSDSTNVIISLRDLNDDVLEGYNIRTKRYYPATGEEVTSEISRTDYNGQAISRLVLYNYYYSFSIEELDGTVIELISPSKIYSEFLTFVVDIEEEELNFEDKVWYSISPNSPVQSQPVNFSLTTVSPGNYIEWFAIGTRFNSTDYLDNSTDADGGTVRIELDLTNQTGWLSITYYIQAENETLLTFDRGYVVTDIIPGDYSIEGQKEGWEDIFDVMWRVIVAVLVSILAVLLLVPYIGPESAGIVGVLVQIGFLVLEWIPLWMVIVEAVILTGLYLMSNRGQV